MSTVLDTLVYDRTYQDIVELRDLRHKIATGVATADERTQYLAGMKGALNYTDLNRIGNCLLAIQSWLADNNITVTITARNDWTLGEIPTKADINKIKTDILNIANTLGYPFNDIITVDYFGAASTDIDPTQFTYLQYNLIEKAIRFLLPTLAFKYKDDDKWYAVQWTPETISLNGYRLIRNAGYSNFNISDICIIGFVQTVTGLLLTSLDNLYFNIPLDAEHSGATGAKNITFDARFSTEIPAYFAYDAQELKTITILNGNNIQAIGARAFSNCWELSTITIPANVTSIGTYAFYACSSLTEIIFPAGLTSIGESAFYYCSALASITYNGTKSQWGNITKGRYWAGLVPATVVHCTDGDVAI